MPKSKTLVRNHVEAALPSDYRKKDFAQAMAIDSQNYVSMLLSDKYPNALLSPNRFEAFAKVCNLSDEEVLDLALARLEDAGDKPIELSVATFKFLLQAHDRLVKAQLAATGALA